MISPLARMGGNAASDTALTRLAQMDARQARVVELRFFGGGSVKKRPLRFWRFPAVP